MKWCLIFLITSCGMEQVSNLHSDQDVKIQLGKLLFHDKLLSGNRNISCATCHHVLAATGDGLSLPVGEGGCGLGVARSTRCGKKIFERVPRNSPSIFNLGEPEFTVIFADGRVSGSRGVFKSPAEQYLPRGFDNALAVQAVFPITSGTEMAGQVGENLQADVAARSDFVGVWDHVMYKIRNIPEYVNMFKQAFHLESEYNMTIVHVGNAIAAFEASAFSAKNSPYDQYIAGDSQALTSNQIAGMNLFSGKAGCVFCHQGKFQTNHKFYSIGAVQLGPGKGDGEYGMEDFGRERVSKDPEDRYRFRVPSLRNVAITGPWTHSGSFNTLRGVIEHHLNPVMSSDNWSIQNAVLPWDEDFDEDFIIQGDLTIRDKICASSQVPSKVLSNSEIDRLVDFLRALTDQDSLDMRQHLPNRVPSGLPIHD